MIKIIEDYPKYRVEIDNIFPLNFQEEISQNIDEPHERLSVGGIASLQKFWGIDSFLCDLSHSFTKTISSTH